MHLVCEHSSDLRICVCAVVATSVCFGSCSRLRYRVVSE